MTKRKRFTAEFKREAVRLLEISQKQPSDLARERASEVREPSRIIEDRNLKEQTTRIAKLCLE